MPRRSTSPKPPAHLPSGRRRWWPACPHPELTLPGNDAGPSRRQWGADGQEPTLPTSGLHSSPRPRLLIWKSVALSGPVFIYLALHTQFSAWVAYGVPLTGPPGRPPGPPAPQRPELPARPPGGVAPSSTIQQLPQPECPRPLAFTVSSGSSVLCAPVLDVSRAKFRDWRSAGASSAPGPRGPSPQFRPSSLTRSPIHSLTPQQQQGPTPRMPLPMRVLGGRVSPSLPSAPPTEGPLIRLSPARAPACAGGCRGGLPRKARSLRALPTAAHYRFDEC